MLANHIEIGYAAIIKQRVPSLVFNWKWEQINMRKIRFLIKDLFLDTYMINSSHNVFFIYQKKFALNDYPSFDVYLK